MIRWLNMSVTEWWLFAGVVLVSGVIEILAIVRPDLLPVITRVSRANGTLWTIWPFLYGFVGGHIWSPQWFKVEAVQRAQPWTLPVVLACVLAFDVTVRRTSVETAFVVYLSAALAGSFVWNTAP